MNNFIIKNICIVIMFFLVVGCALEEKKLKRATHVEKTLYFSNYMHISSRKVGFFNEIKNSDVINYNSYNKVYFISGKPKKIETYNKKGDVLGVTLFDKNGLLDERIVYPFSDINGKYMSCITNKSTQYQQVCNDV